MDCIFCRIVRKENPAHLVHEDDQTMAFLDINPVTQGHTLVIPKRHYRDLLEIPQGELGAVMATAHRVAGAISESLDVQGINLLQSNGAPAGQVIFHFHLHVIPRYENDGLRLWHRHDYRETDFAAVRERIRAALDFGPDS